MTTLNRRSFITSVGVGSVGAVLLAGCATTKNGSVTTATLNVKKVQNYITAGLNAANTVITLVSAIPTLASYAVPLTLAVGLLKTASVEFDKAVGDELTVSYDTGSVKLMINSILDTLQQIVGQIGDVILAMMGATSLVSDKTILKTRLTRDSLATVISVFAAVLTTSFASNSHVADMSNRYATNEFHALKTLGV